MATHSSGEITQIFKARATILEILKRRGYDTSNYAGASVSEVHSMYQNDQLDMMISDDQGKKVYIKFHLRKNLRQNNIYEYVEDLFIGEVLSRDDDLIIIDSDDPNDTAMKTLREIWAKEKRYVSVISIPRLQYNVLEHTMVPKHEPLNADQKQEVMEKFNVDSDKKFGDISRFDPVAAVLGLRPGQLCKITRPSRTAINGLMYRICSA